MKAWTLRKLLLSCLASDFCSLRRRGTYTRVAEGQKNNRPQPKDSGYSRFGLSALADGPLLLSIYIILFLPKKSRGNTDVQRNFSFVLSWTMPLFQVDYRRSAKKVKAEIISRLYFLSALYSGLPERSSI